MTPRAYEIAATVLRIADQYKASTLDDEPYVTQEYIVGELGDKRDTISVINNFLVPMKYFRLKKSNNGLKAYEISPLGKNYLLNKAGSREIQLHVDSTYHSISSDTTTIVSKATINEGIVSINIRSDLYDHIKKYLRDEDYFHAVEESYKFVRVRLKTITGSEKATIVFGYDANHEIDYESIFGHKPADEIERDFFKGVRFIHLAVQFLRNEKSHSLATTLDKDLALHYIALANLAYDLISRGVKG